MRNGGGRKPTEQPTSRLLWKRWPSSSVDTRQSDQSSYSTHLLREFGFRISSPGDLLDGGVQRVNLLVNVSTVSNSGVHLVHAHRRPEALAQGFDESTRRVHMRMVSTVRLPLFTAMPNGPQQLRIHRDKQIGDYTPISDSAEPCHRYFASWPAVSFAL